MSSPPPEPNLNIFNFADSGFEAHMMTAPQNANHSESESRFDIIDDDEEKTIASFFRRVCSCFPFVRSEKAEDQAAIQPRLQSTEKKSTLRPILHRHAGGMESRVEATPYSWPHDSSFDPKTTALVVIDMQKDFCSPEGYLQFQGYNITPVREIIPQIQSLLKHFREKGFTVYHTREGHRPDLSTLSSRELSRSKNNETGKGIGDQGPLGRLLIRGEKGHDTIPEVYPLPDENIIDKPGRSAFQHTEFGLMLSIKGIKNLVLCGATTDVCVTTTMRDANDNNFDCLLVEDATAASEAELHKAAVEMVKTEGGIFGAVSSTAKILSALGVGKAEPFVKFDLQPEKLFKHSVGFKTPAEEKGPGFF